MSYIVIVCTHPSTLLCFHGMHSKVTIISLFSHNLTWRDIQYLIVYTSNPALTNSVRSTNINGAGLQVSRQFGFGVMDAEAMVTRARHWINVPPQLGDSVIPATNSG